MTIQRVVFEQLDDALGMDRGPNGEPSESDFIVLELPVVERFATDLEGLPEIVEGVPAGRMLITSGVWFGPSPCSAERPQTRRST